MRVYRFFPGVDGQCTNEEFVCAHLASAESWNQDFECLVSGGFFMYRAALYANRGELGPANNIVQGILPLLQFCVGRDKRQVQNILNSGVGNDEQVDCSNFTWMSVVDMNKIKKGKEKYVEFKSETYQAWIVYDNVADIECTGSGGVDPLQPHGWNCTHCNREIGNIYLRCLLCQDEKEMEHYLCADCFLSGRHFDKDKRWKNYDKAHKCESRKTWKHYMLRFRYVTMDRLTDVVQQCKEQLSNNGLEELPETAATIEHLMMADKVIKDCHIKA